MQEKVEDISIYLLGISSGKLLSLAPFPTCIGSKITLQTTQTAWINLSVFDAKAISEGPLFGHPPESWTVRDGLGEPPKER